MLPFYGWESFRHCEKKKKSGGVSPCNHISNVLNLNNYSETQCFHLFDGGNNRYLRELL